MASRFLGAALAAAALLSAAEARQTWNGCTCKTNWDGPDGFKCTSGCCNPDEDPAGDWCMVEDISCEDVDWGYCRMDFPATGDGRSNDGDCFDDPSGWTDSEGDNCQSYVNEQLCNANGGYGFGWDAEWGTFFDFAKDGKTAVEACCGCGGGYRAAGLAPQDMCTDLPSWKDKDGDDCAAYTQRAWCNSTGYGVGWHNEWGDFKDFAVSGNTAFTACCACGGGTRQGSTALIARTTWNGCACKKGWTDQAGAKCDGYCCNTDNDPNGDWCMVEDVSCEDFDWGYCRPLGALVSRGSQCGDDPPGWIDSEGDSCDDYDREGYCNDFGGYGPGWEISWGTFHTFMNQQRTAATACCKCGGGHQVWQPTLAQACEDVPGWKDKDGDDCAAYKSMAWCTEDGAGPGWHEEWGDLYSFAYEGMSAVEACCHCGGGSRTRNFMQTMEVGRQSAARLQREKPWVLPGVGVMTLSIIACCCLTCCCVFRKEVVKETQKVAEKAADAVGPPPGGKYGTVHEDD